MARLKVRRGSSRPETSGKALPELLSSLLLVMLLWLFAQLVFLPISSTSFTGEVAKRVTSIVALLFLIAIGVLLPKTISKDRNAIRILANTLVRRRYPEAREAKKKEPFYEALGNGLLFAFLGVILSSLAYWVHPAFGGMILLVTIITVFIFVLQAATP
jgi:hypothetical protein